MPEGKKPKSAVATTLEEALENASIEPGQEIITQKRADEEVVSGIRAGVKTGLTPSTVEESIRQFTEAGVKTKESSAEFITARQSEAAQAKERARAEKLNGIKDCPSGVFEPIWNKVKILLTDEYDAKELEIEEYEVDEILRRHKGELPELKLNLCEKIRLAKSLRILEKAMEASPGSYYTFQKMKQSLIEGGPMEKGHIEKGTMLMADIEGFTSLMGRKYLEGKVGADEVGSIIKYLFKELCEVTANYKGLVMEYGGDALTAYYHGREEEKRAKVCALKLKEVMDAITKIASEKLRLGANFDESKLANEFSKLSFAADFKKLTNMTELKALKFNIGMATNEFRLSIFGDEERREFMIQGPGIDNMNKAADDAEGGQIIIRYPADEEFPEGRQEFVETAPTLERFEPDWKLYLGKLLKEKVYRKKIDDKHVKFDNQFLANHSVGDIDSLCHAINHLSASMLPFSPPGMSDQFFRPDAEPEWSTGSTAVFIKFADLDYKNTDKNDTLSEKFPKLHRIVTEYKGRDKLGASFMILFMPLGKAGGSARRAYECAHRILSECTDDDSGLQLKIGIATGNMMIGQFGARGIGKSYDVTALGDSVNMAARLMAKAEPGEILVTPEVFDAIESRVQLPDIRYGKFKGKEGEIKYFMASGLEDIYGLDMMNYLETAREMYGRVDEMKMLDAVISDVESGHSRSILLEAVAGTGKTKLLKHFLKECDPEKMNLYGAGADVHTQNKSLHLWKHVLGDILKLDPSSGNKTKEKEKALKAFEEKGFKDSQATIVLLSLMGLDDKTVTVGEVREALSAFLEQVALSKAIVIALEDLHWADGDSLDTLNFLMEALSDSSVLFLSTQRPDRKETKEIYSETIKLTRLSKEDTEAVIRDALMRNYTLNEAISVDQHVSEKITDYIYNASEGNPFYTEELVYSLEQDGYLKYGQFSPLKDLKDRPKLPKNISEQTKGRIAELKSRGIIDEKVEDILHLLGVIGNSPPSGLFESLVDQSQIDPRVIEKSLTRLIKHNLIERSGHQLTFRHDLIRKAIEDKLSPRKLIELHRQSEGYLSQFGSKYAERIFYHTYEALENYGKAAGRSYKELASTDAEAHSLIEKMYLSALVAIGHVRSQPGSQHVIIDYAEHALNVFDLLDEPLQEKRKLKLEIASQLTSIGAEAEVKRALDLQDECLETSEQIPETPDNLFEQLNILGRRMETKIMLNDRKKAAFLKMYAQQNAILDLLIGHGFSENPHFKLHVLLAERSQVHANLYKANDLKEAGKTEKADKILKETLSIVDRALEEAPEEETQLVAWFYYLKARVYQERGNHQESYRNFSTALNLFKDKSDDFTSTTIIRDIIIGTHLECFNWGLEIKSTATTETQKILANNKMSEAIQLASETLKYFEKRGEIKAVCSTLEKLAHYACEMKDWVKVKELAYEGYKKAKDHKIPPRLAYALVNLAEAYAQMGQIERGRKYYNELLELYPTLTELHRNFLDKEAFQKILNPFYAH